MQIRGTFAPGIAAGHEVAALVRDKKGDGAFRCDPHQGRSTLQRGARRIADTFVALLGGLELRSG